MARPVTVRQALESVARDPNVTDELSTPVWRIVAHNLFRIANTGDPSVRGSISKALTAQEMIFTRMVGRRRAGSHPAAFKEKTELKFRDLTGKELT